MSQVFFDPEVGGDGSTVSDDDNPATGLRNYGHVTRFVPALTQLVAVTRWTKAWCLARKAEMLELLGQTNASRAAASGHESAAQAAAADARVQATAAGASAEAASASARAAGASEAASAASALEARNGVEAVQAALAEDVIDDASISTMKTWSSQRIAVETGRASNVSYTRSGGRLSLITEVLPGGERKTVFTYSAIGDLATMAVTYGGKTRTTTFHYVGRVLAGMTTEEI